VDSAVSLANAQARFAATTTAVRTANFICYSVDSMPINPQADGVETSRLRQRILKQTATNRVPDQRSLFSG